MNRNLSCGSKSYDSENSFRWTLIPVIPPNDENKFNGSQDQNQANEVPVFKTHFSIVTQMLNQANETVYREQNISFIIQSCEKLYSFYSNFNPKPFRKTAIEWMIKAVRKLNIKETSLYLTCYYFDKFVASHAHDELTEATIQNLALSCLYLATRFNEHSPLSIGAILTLGGNTFTKKDILGMHDQLVSKVLNFELSIPTIFDLYILLAVKIGMIEREFILGLFLAECSLFEVTSLADIKLVVLSVVYLIIVIQKKAEAQFAPLLKLADVKSRKFQLTLLRMVSNAEQILNSDLTSIKQKYAAVF